VGLFQNLKDKWQDVKYTRATQTALIKEFAARRGSNFMRFPPKLHGALLREVQLTGDAVATVNNYEKTLSTLNKLGLGAKRDQYLIDYYIERERALVANFALASEEGLINITDIRGAKNYMKTCAEYHSRAWADMHTGNLTENERTAIANFTNVTIPRQQLRT